MSLSSCLLYFACDLLVPHLWAICGCASSISSDQGFSAEGTSQDIQTRPTWPYFRWERECVRTHTPMHTHWGTHRHVYQHTHTHTRTHTHTHTNTHTHTHTHLLFDPIWSFYLFTAQNSLQRAMAQIKPWIFIIITKPRNQLYYNNTGYSIHDI